MKDARRFHRLSLNTSIKFKQYRDYEKRIYYEDKETEALALDIGEGGMGIQTTSFIAEKTYLEIWISLSSLNEEGQMVFCGPIRIIGKVRWIVPWEEKTFRLGISFLEMQEQDRKAIRDFISAHIGVKVKTIHPKDVSSGTIL